MDFNEIKKQTVSSESNRQDDTHEKKIELVIKYVAGNYLDSFNVNQKIEHVFDKAVQYFQIDRTHKDKLGLFFSGALLEKSQSIEHYSLDNQAILILSVIQTGDIDGCELCTKV